MMPKSVKRFSDNIMLQIMGIWGRLMKSAVVLLVLALGGLVTPAVAQSVGNGRQATADEYTSQRRYRTISTRLEVYPSSRQVRRCVDWYQIERRPSGTVLTPQMRCWWARK
jgi:hypothetical protein